MESVISTPKRKKFTGKGEDIITLSFPEDENIDQLMKELEEEKMLGKENQALKMIAEINFLNSMRYNNLSRVA